MKNIRFYTTMILMAAGLVFVASKTNAQKINSLYFLENTPINARMNPAMSPKYSGFGIGLSSFSYYLQSDLALDDIYYPQSNGELYSFMHPDVDKNVFLSKLNDVSSFSFGTNLELFSLGIRINKKSYLSVHTGINFDLGLGVPKDFFRFFLLGMDENTEVSTFDMKSLKLEAMLYSKTGGSFSTQVNDKIKIGIGLNYLQGYMNASMGFDEFKIDASETKWDVSSQGYLQIAAPEELQLAYSEDGYLNNIENTYEMNSSGDYSATFNSMAKVGSGFSIDLGVTVKPLDYLTISASLTDIGSINWNEEYIQKATSNGSFSYEGSELDEITGNKDNSGSSNNQLGEKLQDFIRFEKATDVESYKTRLTTKLNLAAELGILENNITFGVLSQTGIAKNGKYSDLMVSANLKPGSLVQTAFTYSLLHGEASSFGAAVNIKLLLFNFFLAADYIPLSYTPQNLPVSNSFYNMQCGLNFMF